MKNRPKVTLWVRQLEAADGGVCEYQVQKTQNTTAVRIGEYLTSQQVNEHIDYGWTVNVSCC